MASNGTNGSAKHENGAGSSLYNVPLQINGKDHKGSHSINITDPSTGKVIHTASAASKQDAIAAVEAARIAFPAWSKTSPSARRDIFLKASAILTSRAEELAGYQNAETGAQDSFSAGFNVPSSASQLKDIAGRITSISATMPVSEDEGKSATVQKIPFGVILAIGPWNAPYILGVRSCAAALAGGNTVVLKGPELSPRCYWAIGSIFKEAGLPDGCLNIIQHRPEDAAEVTTALIEHPAVKKINFTGSTLVGSIIAAQAGKALKPCLMELGGKAPAIVLEDADLELAARECAVGAFLNSGQICMSTERIIVHTSIVPAFTSALKTFIGQAFGSSQVLITPAGVTKSHKLLNDAVSKGAKLTYGDLSIKEDSNTRMHPIVVEGLTKDMDLFYQESFGPSVALMPFETEAEAVRMANDTEYGLNAAVFSRDLARALRVAKEIDAGAVHINGMTVHDEPNLMHGGVKRSGWGRFNADYGIDEFLTTKLITWMD